MFNVGDKLLMKVNIEHAGVQPGDVVEFVCYHPRYGQEYCIVTGGRASKNPNANWNSSWFVLASTPHKHAALIKAWADDTSLKLQCRRLGEDEDEWCDLPTNPSWSRHYDYRIKPEPKPDTVCYAYFHKLPRGYPSCANENGYLDAGPLQFTTKKTPLDNIKATFDGETGDLKSVEMIS